MTKNNWKIARRTFLKGMGAMLALPVLEVMGDEAQLEEQAITRVCYIFFGNGVVIRPKKSVGQEWNWWPHQTGKNYTFTKSLSPFEPLRDKITIMGGLWHPNYSGVEIHGDSFMWMTGNNVGEDKGNKYTADQIFADKYGKKTRFHSLILSSEGGIGMLDNAATLSAGSSGRPLPSLNDPRIIFKRLFKSAEANDKETQRQDLRYQRKLVDMVMENAKDMNHRISINDKAMMDQYLTSLNEIEETINRNFEWLDKPRKSIDTKDITENVDPNIDPDKFYTTMFNMMSLAFQADLTRSITFAMTMSGPFGIADKFPPLLFKGAPGHHNWSHANGDFSTPLHMGLYDQYFNSKTARFLTQLDSIKQNDSTLLDNTTVLYGSANSSNHNWKNLPLILAGGSKLGFKHGRHIQFSPDSHMNDLHLTILQAVGIDQKSYGDSKGVIKELFTA